MTQLQDVLRETAQRLESLADRTTGGDWRVTGLLATRPEVVAVAASGSEHVADARAGSATWIAALSPAVAAPLAALLRTLAEERPADEAAAELARLLLERLDRRP